LAQIMLERRLCHAELNTTPINPTPLPAMDRQGPPNRDLTRIGSGESGNGENGPTSNEVATQPEGVGSTLAWVEAGIGISGALKAGLELYANTNNLWVESVPWYGKMFLQAANEAGLPPNLALATMSAAFTAFMIDGIRGINQTR
jgi:hypothetical protein